MLKRGSWWKSSARKRRRIQRRLDTRLCCWRRKRAFIMPPGPGAEVGSITVMPSLNFKGKALVQNFHLLVPYHELKPVKTKSLTAKVSLHDNLVVHGDNLKA